MDVFTSQALPPRPLLWVCVPGGGMNRQYFDLDVPGQDHTFSMARQLAAGGDLVVTVDPPGVGGSDAPDDGYTLTPHVVADVLAAAIDSFVAGLCNGGTGAEELESVSPGATVGLGHSAGALLVAIQQARHRSYDALALLGFSASGLPGVLSEEERRYAGRPEEFTRDVAGLTKARFADPLPRWSNRSSSAGKRDERDRCAGRSGAGRREFEAPGAGRNDCHRARLGAARARRAPGPHFRRVGRARSGRHIGRPPWTVAGLWRPDALPRRGRGTQPQRRPEPPEALEASRLLGGVRPVPRWERCAQGALTTGSQTQCSGPSSRAPVTGVRSSASRPMVPPRGRPAPTPAGRRPPPCS